MTSFEKSLNTIQLAQLKFSLNKFAKIDNIDDYSLPFVNQMKELYDKYIKDSEGVDIDFPEFKFNITETLTK